jgi:hypothetical protein
VASVTGRRCERRLLTVNSKQELRYSLARLLTPAVNTPEPANFYVNKNKIAFSEWLANVVGSLHVCRFWKL